MLSDSESEDSPISLFCVKCLHDLFSIVFSSSLTRFITSLLSSLTKQAESVINTAMVRIQNQYI